VQNLELLDMLQTDKSVFINCLQMDFPSEPELELFLKSLDEIWTDTLYSSLSSAGLIRHVVSKVWNKDQHRISMVFEYDSRDGYLKCQNIIEKNFVQNRNEALKKFVFKMQNNRGLILSEYRRPFDPQLVDI
tara:strand:+ start:218 stop:613 length:396 start_codon:yes stop_codon:yes gene_type:complete